MHYLKLSALIIQFSYANDKQYWKERTWKNLFTLVKRNVFKFCPIGSYHMRLIQNPEKPRKRIFY